MGQLVLGVSLETLVLVDRLGQRETEETVGRVGDLDYLVTGEPQGPRETRETRGASDPQVEKDHLVSREIVKQMDVQETVVHEETEEFLVQREMMADTGQTEGMVSLV